MLDVLFWGLKASPVTVAWTPVICNFWSNKEKKSFLLYIFLQFLVIKTLDPDWTRRFTWNAGSVSIIGSGFIESGSTALVSTIGPVNRICCDCLTWQQTRMWETWKRKMSILACSYRLLDQKERNPFCCSCSSASFTIGRNLNCVQTTERATIWVCFEWIHIQLDRELIELVASRFGIIFQGPYSTKSSIVKARVAGPDSHYFWNLDPVPQ